MSTPPSVSSARSRAKSIPETKRKTIGRLFIEVFEQEAGKARRRRIPGAGDAVSRRDRERVRHRRAIGDDQVAPQCRRAARAHEHELVEPLRELFKDEVRALGRSSACPSTFIAAIPFPGPAWPSATRAGSPAKSSRCCARPSDLSRRDPQGRPLRRDLAGFRGAVAGADGGRHGRWPHLRIRLRAARRHLDRRHDRRFLSTST